MFHSTYDPRCSTDISDSSVPESVTKFNFHTVIVWMVTMMPQDVSGTLLTPKRDVGLKSMLIRVGVT